MTTYWFVAVNACEGVFSAESGEEALEHYAHDGGYASWAELQLEHPLVPSDFILVRQVDLDDDS